MSAQVGSFRRLELLVAVVMIVVAAVLLTAYRDAEYGWFRGRPLGIVLGALGVLDLVNGVRRRRD